MPPEFIAALLLLASVLAGKVSGRFGIPALLLFLVIGILAGSDGPGGIAFDDADLASSLGSIALAFILFAGGLDTHWNSVRPIIGPGFALATVGTLVTAVVAGLAAVLIFDIPIVTGLLVGAIISSTDAAAVFSVLRSRSIALRGRLSPLLEFESASNDPMAVFLTVAFTTMRTSPDASAFEFAILFLQQMSIGLVLGVAGGWVAVWAVNRIQLEYEGLYPVLTVALVLLTYSSTALLGGSGFLAVYLVGLSMARRRVIHKRSLSRFHDGVGWLMQIAMFLMLGLLVFPSELPAVAAPGLALAAVLMLVARPVAVWVSLPGRQWTWRDRTLVSWVGLRGAVPIILATFPLAAGVPHASTVFNAVFFVVFLSVALQGTTIPFVARRLRLDGPADSVGGREEIVGSTATGRRLHTLTIPDGSWVHGRQVVELDLPMGTWLAMVRRGENLLVPQGPTVLRANDEVTILASRDDLRIVKQTIKHTEPP